MIFELFILNLHPDYTPPPTPMPNHTHTHTQTHAFMVDVAQLVLERWIVVPEVAGSNPVFHPKFSPAHLSILINSHSRYHSKKQWFHVTGLSQRLINGMAIIKRFHFY